MKLKQKVKPTLKEVKDAGDSLVSEALAKKRKHEQDVKDTMDAGFFFSVVFRSKDDRDAWLASKGLRLRDSEFILADDFNV